jgi:hypothetical protein
MSNEEWIGAIRKAIEKMAVGFVASLEEEKQSTPKSALLFAP